MAAQEAESSSILKWLHQKFKPRLPNFEKDKRQIAAAFIQLRFRLWQLRTRGADGSTYKVLKQKKRVEELQVVWHLLALIHPVMEFTLACLTISWRGDMDGYESTSEMNDVLVAGTVCVNVVFFIFWLHTPISSFTWWLDLAVVPSSLMCVILWSEWNDWGQFDSYQIFAYTLLAMYRGYRVLCFAIYPRQNYVRDLVRAAAVRQVAPVDSFHFIFSSRSVALVELVWPELNYYYEELEKVLGPYGAKICKMDVHLTEKNAHRLQAFKEKIQGTRLYQAGGLRLVRLDTEAVLTQKLHTRIADDVVLGSESKPSASSMLVAFCGNTTIGVNLAAQCNAVQAAGQAIPGSGNHTIEFTQENYGHISNKPKTAKPSKTAHNSTSFYDPTDVAL